jgi:hypothetical protein
VLIVAQQAMKFGYAIKFSGNCRYNLFKKGKYTLENPGKSKVPSTSEMSS